MDNFVVKTKKIGNNVVFHPFCFIEEDVAIGNNVIIHSGVKIENGVEIGDNVEMLPNCHIGRVPKNPGCLSRNLQFKNKTIIQDNCVISSCAIIYCDVRIGQNCLIGDGASVREGVEINEFSVIGRNTTVNYNTKIGKRTKIMDLSVITGNCVIGDDVFISCLVATTNDKRFGKGGDFDIQEMLGPLIEDNVAIGAGSNILHGTRIGKGSVVAAGSIVTKDVDSGVLVMGSPASKARDL
jgi:acetyltransferase-like isoleucine patch superfamily enzyme